MPTNYKGSPATKCKKSYFLCYLAAHVWFTNMALYWELVLMLKI